MGTEGNDETKGEAGHSAGVTDGIFWNGAKKARIRKSNTNCEAGKRSRKDADGNSKLVCAAVVDGQGYKFRILKRRSVAFGNMVKRV